jgi:hypothetical protein
MSLFQELSTDIIIYILQFGTAIKYRNGKFMDQIQFDDLRYELLAFVKPAIKCSFEYATQYYHNIHPYRLSLYIIPSTSSVYEPIRYNIVFYNEDNESVRYVYVML